MKRATIAWCLCWLSVLAIANPTDVSVPRTSSLETVTSSASVSDKDGTIRNEFIGWRAAARSAVRPSAFLPQRLPFSKPLGAVLISGEVREPGTRELMQGTTLRAAVLAAGGPSERADTSNIRIVRASGDGKTTDTADLRAIMMGTAPDPVLGPNDRVEVPVRSNMNQMDTKTALTIAVVFLLIIILASH